MQYNKVDLCGVDTAALKVLSEEEKRALLLRMRSGTPEERRRAREEMISGNLRLVLSVIQRFSARGENLDDLFQVGVIGLIKAIDNFDVSLDVRFSTYGVPMTYRTRNQGKRLFQAIFEEEFLMSMFSLQQAIEIAAQSVEMRTDLSPATHREVLEKLENLSKHVWMTSWNKKTIVEALHKFKEENGRAPNVTDLNLKCLPSGGTIQAHFHITASLFLKQMFPENRCQPHSFNRNNVYGFVTEEDWLECFITQFNKHLCPEMNARYYDRFRDDSTPTWHTIAKHTGTLTWGNLMKKAGVKYVGSRGIETAHTLILDDADSPLISKFSRMIEERQALNEELVMILTKRKRDADRV